MQKKKKKKTIESSGEKLIEFRWLKPLDISNRVFEIFVRRVFQEIEKEGRKGGKGSGAS